MKPTGIDDFASRDPDPITARDWILLGVAALIGACLVCTEPAHAQPVELRGKIGPDMTAKVERALAQGQREFTINTSTGGYMISAKVMADAMNRAGAALTVNGFCYSACALLVVGVRDHRFGEGADVQFHSSYVQGVRDTSDAADYLAELGLPRELAAGPNLHRLDRSVSAPPSMWANRDPFH